jgi:AcrR family transcriptional regulator
VDAALEVFAVRGYRAGALADIADRVGLTPAAIIYHFGSKEALLLAVIEERDRRAGDLLAQLPADAGIDGLRGLVAIAELMEREPGLAALHTVLQAESFEPDAPAHEYFRDRSRLVRGWLEKVLRRAQRAGEVRADVDCEVRARELIAFQEGAAVMWLIDRTVPLVRLYEGYIDGFVRSIKVEADGPDAAS